MGKEVSRSNILVELSVEISITVVLSVHCIWAIGFFEFVTIIMNFEVFNMQVLSPYILRKKSKTGELFFNSKNNHS